MEIEVEGEEEVHEKEHEKEYQEVSIVSKKSSRCVQSQWALVCWWMILRAGGCIEAKQWRKSRVFWDK